MNLKWYFFTRALGGFMVLYGLVVDHSPERGTIIITGAGLAGFDAVARQNKDSESSKG